MFKENSSKFGVLKLTAASFVTGIGKHLSIFSPFIPPLRHSLDNNLISRRWNHLDRFRSQLVPDRYLRYTSSTFYRDKKLISTMDCVDFVRRCKFVLWRPILPTTLDQIKVIRWQSNLSSYNLMMKLCFLIIIDSNKDVSFYR